MSGVTAVAAAPIAGAIAVTIVAGMACAHEADVRSATRDGAVTRAWTTAFEDAAALVPAGRNPWFILEPGYVLVLRGTEDGEAVEAVITVLADTRTVAGALVRAVEERETKGGELAEVTKDWYAISPRTNSVYYFGEDVDEYGHGKVSGHGSAWMAGVKGAAFGLMMPGLPLLGARYHQEQAPGVGMDRAEIMGLDETVTTPAGTFRHCLKTEETNPLEPGSAETKLYAPGVGLVRDGGLSLVRYGGSK